MRPALTVPEFVLLPENASRTILAEEFGISIPLTLGSKSRSVLRRSCRMFCVYGEVMAESRNVILPGANFSAWRKRRARRGAYDGLGDVSVLQERVREHRSLPGETAGLDRPRPVVHVLVGPDLTSGPVDHDLLAAESAATEFDRPLFQIEHLFDGGQPHL